MNTSAKTRSGRTSEILRTAASPLPTATTSMPWSFRARPTIFWILLLSSATRILATNILRGQRDAKLRVRGEMRRKFRPNYDSIVLDHRGNRASTETGAACVGSKHGRRSCPKGQVAERGLAGEKERGTKLVPPLESRWRKDYQGTILRMPFFF